MKKIAIIVFCLTAVTAVFFLTFKYGNRNGNGNGEEYIPAIVPLEYDPEDISPVSIPLAPAYHADIPDTGYLKLVNRELYQSRQTCRSQIVYAWPTVQVSTTAVTIHQTALNAIAALFADARYIEEFGSFFITSGYRSYDRQREIYDNAADRAYVLPPGHSEHQLGLAADILVLGIPMAQMSGTPEAVWLAENAWQHGLILRYPRGTTHITGVAYEPWHFRYVGRIHAWYMRINDMVLEEYLEYLEEQGGFTAVLDGVTYHVLYKQVSTGYILIPVEMEFTMSTSNRGGYVITAWE